VTTGCLWFTFLNQRRGRSGNIVIGILIPRSGQPVRIERRRQRTADDPSKESPTRCAMKAIDNVYGQRAYNLLSILAFPMLPRRFLGSCNFIAGVIESHRACQISR
jgi:hypothetical protein